MSAAALQRRPDRRAVWVALGTTVMMNGALYALLALLHRAPPEPAAELPVVRRVERVVPPPPPLALAQPAVAVPAAAAPQVAVAAPALPALPDFTPQLALPAAAMPTVTPTTVVRLPAVTAAGAGGQNGSGLGATSAAPLGAAGGPDQTPFLTNGFDMERFYPRAARLRGIEGTSLLRLEIDAAGKVTACKVLASDPPGVFDREAEGLGYSLKFLPARSHGVASATVVQQQIAWKLPR